MRAFRLRDKRLRASYGSQKDREYKGDLLVQAHDGKYRTRTPVKSRESGPFGAEFLNRMER
jgi:hypothetical protein